MDWKEKRTLEEELAQIAGVNYLDVELVHSINQSHNEKPFFADITVTEGHTAEEIANQLNDAGYYGDTYQEGLFLVVSVCTAKVVEPEF